jgi:CheY-like chemotaxis protein
MAAKNPDQPTILFVDDEQIVLDSARKLLRKEPLQVDVVHSGGEGLVRLEQGGVDIVLTDLMMPGMDGLELLRRIKDRWPALPVIMVTGYATISTAMEAMRLGAFDYIAKPFTREELRGIVKRALHMAAEVARTSEVRTLGHNSWLVMQQDGSVLIGVESAFVQAAGPIQDIDLPKVGDVLNQGAVCLQIFSADLQSHTVWSPLSGEVLEVNERVREDPATILQDPYGEGWLLRVRPSHFEDERKVLGL